MRVDGESQKELWYNVTTKAVKRRDSLRRGKRQTKHWETQAQIHHRKGRRRNYLSRKKIQRWGRREMNPENNFILFFFREFRHFIKPHFHKMDSVKRATGKWRMCVCHWDDSWKNLTLFHSTPSITTANELINKIRFSFSFSQLINRIIRRPFPYSLSPVSNPMRFINRAHQFN